MGAIMHDCKNGLSPQPPNLARNNVEALENPDLVLDGRDNRAGRWESSLTGQKENDGAPLVLRSHRLVEMAP